MWLLVVQFSIVHASERECTNDSDDDTCDVVSSSSTAPVLLQKFMGSAAVIEDEPMLSDVASNDLAEQRVAAVKKPVTVPHAAETAEKVVKLEAAHVLESKSTPTFECKLQNTVWDVGMNDAGDTRSYLATGACVIAVEADPDLVDKARQDMASYISSGQLRIVHKAISIAHDVKKFWKSKINDEWNSFDRGVACRGTKLTGRRWKLEPANCYPISVDSIPCGDLLQTYGVPLYMKLDIEGQEKSCLDGLQALPSGSRLPQYVSSEMNGHRAHLQLKQLGYTRFKLVRQDLLVRTQDPSSRSDGWSTRSGGWGDLAMDCERHGEWSTYDEFIARSANDTSDCPNRVWYDVHAARDM
jgi:FkbM family methyltransferase